MNIKVIILILSSVLASASYAMDMDLDSLMDQLSLPTAKENQSTQNTEKQPEESESVEKWIALLSNQPHKPHESSKSVCFIHENKVLHQQVMPRQQANPDVQQFLAQYNK